MRKLFLNYIYRIAGMTAFLAIVTTGSAEIAKASVNTHKTENLIISDKQQFIFKDKSLAGDVTAMLNKGDAAYIISENDNYYYVKSGKYKGYIEKDHVLIKEEAISFADKNNDHTATATADTLFLYEKKDKNSTILSVFGKGNPFNVIRKDNDWYYINTETDIKGYVPENMVDISIDFTYAKEPDLDVYANLYPEKVLSTYESDEAYDMDQNDNITDDLDTSYEYSQLGNQVVEYARQFIGNKYVYGGTSLTGGIDCSGFVMRIYEKFGINLPRTSGEQSTRGALVCKKIDESVMNPGDLIFFANNKGSGSVHHVAMYAGNGKVVHASNSNPYPVGGIKESDVHYNDEEVVCVRRVIPNDTMINRTIGHKVSDYSEEDISILERIVEAEAGDQGVEGMIYVADVILNRVSSKKFPNTIHDVVFAPGQFSPISNGRYDSVTISADAKKAVSYATTHSDTSQGALYFMYRAAANPKNITWFDTALEFLFKYKDHEFFK